MKTFLPADNAPDEFAADTLKPNIDDPRAPAVLHYLPGAFLLLVLLVGAALALSSKAARSYPIGQDVITGKAAHAYETALDAGVAFRDPSVGFWATLNYRLFHEARSGALVGAEGWLFTDEEFQTNDIAQDTQERQVKIRYIGEVLDELKKKGSKLVVALVPAKTRVYPEKLGRLSVPAEQKSVYEDFRRRVMSLGIHAPDLFLNLTVAKSRGHVFVRTDTHWSPLGAEIAAQVIAKEIKTAYPALDLPMGQFRTTEAAEPSNIGDLLRYLPLPKGVGPQAEQLRLPTTVRTDSGGGGLLGDDPVAVALVGTSYSAVKDWNFAGALRQALGTDLVNAASEGEGPIIPMRAYLKSQAYRDTPPKLVIWEIPERYLRIPYPEAATNQ